MLALGKNSGSKLAIPDRTFKCSRGFHLYPGAIWVESSSQPQLLALVFGLPQWITSAVAPARRRSCSRCGLQRLPRCSCSQSTRLIATQSACRCRLVASWAARRQTRRPRVSAHTPLSVACGRPVSRSCLSILRAELHLVQFFDFWEQALACHVLRKSSCSACT